MSIEPRDANQTRVAGDKTRTEALDRLRADMAGVYRCDDLDTLRNEWEDRQAPTAAEGAGSA